MDDRRKVIVGYDLTKEYIQISCYSYKFFEPIPISIVEDDEESSKIPTVLYVCNETGNWLFGQEALDCAGKSGGELVENIIEKVISGKTIQIRGEKISGIQLLEKLFRRSLALLKREFPGELITKLVVTVKEMTPVLVSGIYEALAMLGIERDRAEVISHSSAYIYYALSQESSLWINDVGLFDFDKDGLKYYQICINKRSTPKIAGVSKKDFTAMLNIPMLDNKDIDLAYILENIAEQVLYKQIISTLYFTGEGFDGGWAEDVLKKLSVGRRAFIGTGIYSKGASYAAKELSDGGKLDEYLLLDDDMIINSVWLLVYTDAKVKETMLVEAGTPWYEVNNTVEIIPDQESEINLVFRNVITKEMKRERFILNNLPQRPNRMTRLGVNVSFISKSLAKIKVKDLGFGEFYPSSNRIWEFNIAQDNDTLEF